MNIRDISIQGIGGSFHDVVRSRLFPDSSYWPRDRFHQIFNDLEAKRSKYGIMAIENSIAGSLVFNYDLLAAHELRIVGEAYLRIRHNLMALVGSKIEEIQEVWSHPMAIYQSQRFLNQLPCSVLEKEDTAASAKKIADQKIKGVAAIASLEAADLYGLEVLAKEIETDPNNYTRFLILSQSGEPLHLRDVEQTKCSLYVRFEDNAGDLYKFLGPLHEDGINMSKIESRPRVGSPWHYDFYLDLDVDRDLSEFQRTLQKLEKACSYMRVLGFYPSFGYI